MCAASRIISRNGKQEPWFEWTRCSSVWLVKSYMRINRNRTLGSPEFEARLSPPRQAGSSTQLRTRDSALSGLGRRLPADAAENARGHRSPLSSGARLHDRTSGSGVRTPFQSREQSGADLQGGALIQAWSAHGIRHAHAPSREQLVDCERALGHNTKLRQQRGLHVGRLAELEANSRRRQQVSAQACLDLARNNELAEHNGYGLALIFLEAGAAPEENVRRLTNYLFALQAASFSASLPDRHQLSRCVDLAAHYLSKTPWFEHVPLWQLVTPGNLLSKYPDRPACLQALSWIAGQVLAPERMPALREKDLTLLANALSKNIGCGRSEQAVARIGRHVLRIGTRDFKAQGVSLILNACSKWAGNPDCRDVAEALATRLAGDAVLRRAMDAQAVANALNALGKWPEQAGCRDAAVAMAVRVANDAALRQAMNAQQVANTLNALSKWPERVECRSAAMALGARVTDETALRHHLKAQEVANALNALGKWPERTECRDAAVSLAARVAGEAGLRRDMDAQAVANVLSALSKWPERAECRDAAVSLAARVTDDAGLRHAMRAQAVANALSALSKWPERVECRDAAVSLAACVAGEAGLRHDMDAQAVATALSALSKWPEWAECRDAAVSLAARVTDDAGLRHAMSAQAVANALSALSKWPERVECRDAAVSLAARMAGEAGLRRDMDAQAVATALSALSKWPERVECRSAVLSLAVRVAGEATLRYAMSAQQVANALNGLSKWPEQPGCRDTAVSLAARVVGDTALLHGMNAQQVANALNALSKWPERAECRNAVLSLSARVTSEALLRHSMDARAVATVLNALSKWPGWVECRDAALSLAVRVADDADLRHGMDAQAVAVALNALGKWPEQAGCRNAALSLAERVAGEPALRHGMKSQEVASALNALSKWPERTECRDAAAPLAARVAGEAGLRRDMDAQAVANVLSALSKWPEQGECEDAAVSLATRVAGERALRYAMDARAVGNALNALGRWPERVECQDAVVSLAARVADETALRRSMDVRAVANALNGLSKWPKQAGCRDAVLPLAARVADDAGLRRDMNSRQVANALNALSKWPERGECRAAAVALAARVANDAALRHDMGAQAVANALNALSKWPEQAGCRNAAVSLAMRAADEAALRRDMDAQAVANALNGLSKWPEWAACGDAAVSLAVRVAGDAGLRRSMSAQAVTNALGALSKWPERVECLDAVLSLAARVADEADLRHAMTAQAVGNVLNALSKWPEQAGCRNAAVSLATRVAGEAALRHDMDAQAVANALNALSKWPEQAGCRDAAVSLAARVSGEASLRRGMIAQAVANVLGALSKWPGQVECADAAVSLAVRVMGDAGLRHSMDAQAVGNALNGLSKWPERAECGDAAVSLAVRVASEAGLRQAMSAQQVANALNALSKWPERAECGNAAVSLAARTVSEVGLQRGMDAQAVANALNALSKWPGRIECRDAAVSLSARVASEVGLRQAMSAQQVANALNALSKWPQRIECRDAAVSLAARVASEVGLRHDMNAQQVTSALNALSKWPECIECRDAGAALAVRMADDTALRHGMDARAVAMALNGLSKWPEHGKCRDAAVSLAVRVASEVGLPHSMNAQQVANVLNALSKWPERVECRDAVLPLSVRVADDAVLRHDMDAQAVANALNALSKWPERVECRDAVLPLSVRVANDAVLRHDMDAQAVANALNALSKWPERAECRGAAVALAARVTSDAGLRHNMSAQQVANALNALSKWPERVECRDAALPLSARVANEAALRYGMDAQAVAMTLNALSKWPERVACRSAAVALSVRVTGDAGLRYAMSAQQVANALNAQSKWPERIECRDAVLSLAERVANEAALRHVMNAQQIANALNALSKWPERVECRDTAAVLSARVADDAALRHGMDTRAMASVLNALSKWPEAPACRRATVLLMALPGEAGHPWRQFDMSGLAQVANASARLFLSAPDEVEVQALASAKLGGLAAHLDLHRERFETASARSIGILFKAMASLQLQAQMRPLARAALSQIESLCRQTGLRDENLEAIGTLCLGLLPLARSSELAAHRRQALGVFDAMQPIAARKVDGFLQAQRTGADAGVHDERYDTRRPALTFYQVLKAYAVVSRRWKPRHIEGARKAVRERREQLSAWVEKTLERTREAIESDLGAMSWNLIAQIEAGDDVLTALDLRLFKQADQITQLHPSHRFDLAAQHHAMRTEPGQLVAAAGGATRHVVVDMQGRELKTNDTEAHKPYSLYARLTGQPLVEVKLPGELSAFMLARTFNYQGEPWRFDMFGGSRLSRGGQRRPSDILAGSAAAASMLPAIRYADSAPGSALMDLTTKLAPQREDWSRMQRALLETVPGDHAVEGTLRMGFFDDVPGEQHPFKLSGPDGQRIQLCPNDGCGFLKFEVAMRIPVFREHVLAWQAVREGLASNAQRALVAADDEPKRLAPQALQHFPRDAEALEEAHRVMQRRLQGLAQQRAPAGGGAPTVNALTLYNLTVSGGYEGQKVRAVPSADDKVHLPRECSIVFDREGGALLIGKPPYDKENLLPVPEDRVATAARGDATAAFLSESFAIQYSYTGFNDDNEDHVDGAEMLHSKGMLIVPPPQYWSPAHEGLDLVCSKEDLKTLSRWKAGRDRAAVPSRMLVTGSLRVKETVLPGRLGALPIAELRKRNMDTDGDDAFIYAGYPKLAALIGRVMRERDARRGRPVSFKPPKTATPAFDAGSGRYLAGRAAEILAEQRGRQLMGSASNLAARFLSQPHEVREAMARAMMFGTYDGIDRSLRTGLRAWFEAGAFDPQALRQLGVQAEEAIGRAHLPEAREAAVLLHEQIRQLQQPALSAPSAMPAALAEHFPQLAAAYERATDTAARIHAILDNYPVCRLSHEQFPNGQPGWIEGEPELTMRNLLTLAIKVGTDALKSDTGTQLFAKVVEACERTERAHADRVRNVPHGKETARAMHDGRFDPEQAKSVLQRMPTMAAGVMQDAVQSLQQAALLAPPPPPTAQLAEVPPLEIAQAARQLGERARQMDRRITPMLRKVVQDAGAALAGERLRLKSEDSLIEKIRQRVARKRMALRQVLPSINDALRYSVVLPPDRFAEGSRRIQAALDAQGHVRTKLTNHFTKAPEPFSAVNVTLRSPEGHLWEIQFHTRESFALKERYHDLYKELHRLRLEGAPAERLRELTRPAREAFRAVPLPPGCENITDWEAA
ncbi:type III secretion system effector protein [Ralstonia nicotianae]|uniref:Type III secretion system effector protein n=2 Tax=Ralstonia nicotianae TaxID=3037696 RepID=A0ABX7ZRM5_9RALS|nr:type III secretion system effector protein [Ralstonia nicotianae]